MEQPTVKEDWSIVDDGLHITEPCDDGTIWVRAGRAWRRLQDLPGRRWNAEKNEWDYNRPDVLAGYRTNPDTCQHNIVRNPDDFTCVSCGTRIGKLEKCKDWIYTGENGFNGDFIRDRDAERERGRGLQHSPAFTEIIRRSKEIIEEDNSNRELRILQEINGRWAERYGGGVERPQARADSED